MRPFALGTFAKTLKAHSSYAMSVLSACISAGLLGWFFVKFDIGGFYENLSINSKFI